LLASLDLYRSAFFCPEFRTTNRFLVLSVTLSDPAFLLRRRGIAATPNLSLTVDGTKSASLPSCSFSSFAFRISFFVFSLEEVGAFGSDSSDSVIMGLQPLRNFWDSMEVST
jgi:hypothetical protein